MIVDLFSKFSFSMTKYIVHPIFSFLFVLLKFEQCHTIPSSDLPHSVKHVIHIGIDGLNPFCISNSSNGGRNILLRLGKQGSGTLVNARTIIETVSAPGWVSIFCSMSSPASGVHSNMWAPPWPPFNSISEITPITGNANPLPTIFSVLKSKNRYIQTAMMHSWKWLSYLGNLATPKSVDYESDFSLCDPYPDRCVTNAAIKYLQSNINVTLPSYTFVYYHSVDTAGHRYGWCGNEYEKHVGNVDNMIGEILNVVESIKGINDSYLVVLTSDHGGRPGQYNHGEANDECIKVPVLFKGPHVRRNYHISSPISNLDITPTIAYLMGYQDPYWSWEGKVIAEILDENY
ncbi:hypothetical protein GJ496_010632 [Pomphorhynchus laevis]|nr:hypothetical protein GJ496_010632 [Pomphorhynchus laevis]